MHRRGSVGAAHLWAWSVLCCGLVLAAAGLGLAHVAHNGAGGGPCYRCAGGAVNARGERSFVPDERKQAAAPLTASADLRQEDGGGLVHGRR